MGTDRDSDDSRGHSRSSSRKKHKKHRHRRSRSRSRGPTIHVNPAFGYQKPLDPSPVYQGGGMASQLLETNRFLETDVSRLKQDLMIAQNNLQMAHHNNSVMATEIRSMNNQKLNTERRCNELSSERRKWVESTCELNAKISSLNSVATALRNECCESRRKCEEKEEMIKGYEYQTDLIRQQIGALNDRNASLKAKCEELVTVNRQKLDEIQQGKTFVENARNHVKKMEADVQCGNLEIQRLMKEVDTCYERDIIWQKEKRSLEQAIGKKDDDIRLLKFNSTKSLNEMTEKVKKYENRLKTEKPALQSEFATESIYRVLETVKNTFSMQLSRLEAEVEQLRKEQEEKEEKIEELPEYLQTPRKPDPSKMNSIHRTPQAIIPTPQRSSVSNHDIHINTSVSRPTRASSGPPVDSPSQWHRLRSVIENDDERDDDEIDQKPTIVLEKSRKTVATVDFDFRSNGDPQRLFPETQEPSAHTEVGSGLVIATESEVLKISYEEIGNGITQKVKIEREEQEVSSTENHVREDDDEMPPEKRIKVETLEVSSDEVYIEQPSTSRGEWEYRVANEIFDISEEDLLGDIGNGDPIENIELIERQIFGDE